MQAMITRTDYKNKFLTSRYIFFPLHDEVKFHWSFLVLDTKTTFIEGYTIACCGNEIEYVKEVNVQQQDDGHLCGVFVCLWAECLIKENMDTFVDIYLNRAQMALTIFRHKYSVYLKDSKELYVN